MRDDPLPPLNGVRAFEACGRLGSFKLAAAEMHVTPGAISRQIALLEAFLGARLFDRRHRAVLLTPAGRRFYDSAAEALDTLRASTRQLRQAHAERPLHIWCPMTFGMKWLAPRLHEYRRLHPGRDVAITTALGPVQWELHGADVAIRIGKGDWPGVRSHRLVGIELLPVCSPRLRPADGSAWTLQDLARQTLLRSAVRPADWTTWLAAAGAAWIDPSHGMTVESASLSYQLAAEGAGVAMAQHALVADDLASGRLVAPFERRVPVPDAFYLITPQQPVDSPHVAAFARWIIGMAEAAERERLGAGGAESA